MSRPEAKRKPESPKLFAELKRYSSAQVVENNLYRKFFAALPDCTSWAEDVVRELLPVSRGNELQITLTNETNSEQKQTLVFTQKEISIGRATTSDIPLPLQSISRHHARIVERDESFYIEDLHSVSGTFVNGRKLDAAHSCLLSVGDEVRMYPYVLRVAPNAMWTRDDRVRIKTPSSPVYLDSKKFVSSFGSDACLFEVGIQSDAGKAVLAISRSLLTTMLARLLRTTKETGLVDADGTLVEFVAVCVLERMNRTLQFPFEFSLCPLSGMRAQQESGLMLETAIQLSSEHGYMRLFLPGSVLEKLAHERSSLPLFARTLLSWQLSLSVGSVTLGSDEIHQVEPGDTLTYTPVCRLILPPEQRSSAPHRGWQVSRSEEEPFHFVVQTFHEWGLVMPQEEKLQEQKTTTGEVDLSVLPVHIHVVLTRVEMSLHELETLSAGSIIQLDEETNSTVQLVSGNTVIGSGELVNIDSGRMGVRITRWGEQ
jgi:flagellar motor switch/type III secretory pathway protein FliN/pSer/pThr/pTyr-binding forkhead associated (FHA) protein